MLCPRYNLLLDMTFHVNYVLFTNEVNSFSLRNRLL